LLLGCLMCNLLSQVKNSPKSKSSWNPQQHRMHWKLGLVIQANNFITTYKDVLSFLDNDLCGCQIHIIHAFYHAPTTIVNICLVCSPLSKIETNEN